jgi:hypothetical protein
MTIELLVDGSTLDASYGLSKETLAAKKGDVLTLPDPEGTFLVRNQWATAAAEKPPAAVKAVRKSL